MLKPLIGESTVVMTLQNGVDSVDEVAAVVGPRARAGRADLHRHGADAARASSSRRARTGASCSARRSASARRCPSAFERIAGVLKAADIQAEAVADARVPLWEKFIYLAPFAAFTGAARLPIGPLWSDPAIRAQFMAAVAEVEAVARAEGVAVREPASLKEYVTQLRGRAAAEPRGRRCSSICSRASASRWSRCRDRSSGAG